MSDSKIIAFVGMPGSGKGTCTDYLEEKYGWPVVHFGNMVYEEVQRRGLDNVKDEKFVREDMRVQDGKDVIAKHALKKAQEHFDNNQKIVIFDGLYSWSEYKYLADELGDGIILIAAVAPRAERYRRILARVDSHRKYTDANQIKERDIAEIENLEKGGPIAFADYTIANNTDKEKMITELETILKDIGL